MRKLTLLCVATAAIAAVLTVAGAQAGTADRLGTLKAIGAEHSSVEEARRRCSTICKWVDGRRRCRKRCWWNPDD